MLTRNGFEVNPKRVYRLWREHQFSLRRRKRVRRRGPRLKRTPVATKPGEIWAYDFAHDRCANGRKLKCLVVVDEYSKECLVLDVRTRINGARVIEVLERLMRKHGSPKYIRSDNGPEFVSKCVRQWLKESGVGPAYIEPGKPWQNGVAESFIGKLRDECLNLEWFYNPSEAQVIVETYRNEYNRERPHSSLGYATPTEFRRLTQENRRRVAENQQSLTLALVR